MHGPFVENLGGTVLSQIVWPDTSLAADLWSGDYAELGEEEGVVEGDFFEVVVAAGGSAVAGVHVDVEEERGGVGFEGAELGDVFGGLPVHDLRVVEAGFDEHGRDGLPARDSRLS